MNKSIDTNGQAYEHANELFKLRNRLVHSKTKTKKIRDLDEEQDFITEVHAEKAITAVIKMMDELSKLDIDLDSSWLREAIGDDYA